MMLGLWELSNGFGGAFGRVTPRENMQGKARQNTPGSNGNN
jgi:hypothetical protein